MKLTTKQKNFCEYYLQTGNATEAARLAGYSDKTARVIGAENLSKPAISEYIASRRAEMDKTLIADSDEVLRFYSAVMRGEVKDQFGLDAALGDRHEQGRADGRGPADKSAERRGGKDGRKCQSVKSKDRFLPFRLLPTMR